jgi:hypothetical protein
VARAENHVRTFRYLQTYGGDLQHAYNCSRATLGQPSD